jgi:hypothetical protein
MLMTRTLMTVESQYGGAKEARTWIIGRCRPG